MKTNFDLATWRERLISPLGWHIASFVLLLVLTVWLGTRLTMDWSATSSRSTSVLAGKQVQLRALQIETEPLRGLDQRVDQTRAQLDHFYARRIPTSYSAISTRIGELGVRSGVRLTRVQYTQNKPGNDLTEISLDASIGGNYPAIMHFVNDIERDPMFLLIRGMSFSGQQGGMVSLRIMLSTWMRPADAAASGLPQAPEPSEPATKEVQ